MEAATRNPDPASPLPLFRPEALAARQNFHGEVLCIRPFSWVFLCSLSACIAAAALGFLLLAQYTPTAKVLGDICSERSAEAVPAEGPLEATFSVGANTPLRIQSGTRLLLHCFRCSQPVSLSGVVVGITTVQPSVDAVSTNLARPGPVHKVTVALLPLNSPPAGRDGLTPGAKLEAEFPLARRPLIRWLIGPAAI